MNVATTGEDSGRQKPSRRAILLGGVTAAAALTLAGPASFASAATPAPIRTLPSEISRRQNQTTAKGTLYDAVQVDISGDRAWIMIPQSLKPYRRTTVGVVWFYHGSGSDHNALLNGFAYEAKQIVDGGGIAICQDVRKNSYSSPYAVKTQADGVAYLGALYKLGPSFLRATSGGGALATWTYGTRAIPNIVGMYFVNAIYDVKASYLMGGQSEIGPAYGFNESLIDATNPATLPSSAWTGARMRIVYSTTGDYIVPPEIHAIRLYERALPTGKEITYRTHTLGHTTPSFVGSEAPRYFNRWLADWMATGA